MKKNLTAILLTVIIAALIFCIVYPLLTQNPRRKNDKKAVADNAAAIDNSPAPVLVLEPVIDRIGNYISHRSLAMQYLVTSELLRKYKCVIVSRNIGLSLGLDREIAFRDRQETRRQPAEWRIGGSHVAGRLLNPDWMEADTEVFCENLVTGEIQHDTLRDEVGSDNEAAMIARSVAMMIGLKRLPKTRPPAAAPSGQVWAVLPFLVLNKLENVDIPQTSEFSDELEMALRNNGGIKLVDRTHVLELFRERQLTDLGLVDPGDMAGLGRLLKADCVVWGLQTADGLDVFLIGSESGAVHGAIRLPSDADASDIPQLIDALFAIEQKDPSPGSERDNDFYERERMRGILLKAESTDKNNSGVTAQYISIAEAYYLMIRDNDDDVFELAYAFYNNVLISNQAMYAPLRSRELRIPHLYPHCREQSYRLLTFMLDNLKNPEQYGVRLARLRYYIATALGHFSESAARLEANPDILPASARRYWVGYLAAGLGDYEKAAKLFSDSGYIPDAMMTLLLADQPERAWQTARVHSEKFVCDTCGFMVYEFLRLEQQYGSDASAAEWLEGYYRKACCPAHLMENKHYTPLAILSAKIYMNLGNFAAAKAALDAASPNMDDPRHDEYLRIRKQLDEITTATAAPEPLTLFDGIPGKERYKIYLLPLNDISVSMLRKSAERITQISGFACEVLPGVDIPSDSCYDSERRQFIAPATVREMRKLAGRLPEDGLLLLGVLNNSMYAGTRRHVTYFFEAEMDGAAVLSTTLTDIPETVPLAALRLLALTGGTEHYCSNIPCMMTLLGGVSISKLDIVMCQECRDAVGRFSPEKANRQFINGNPKK